MNKGLKKNVTIVIMTIIIILIVAVTSVVMMNKENAKQAPLRIIPDNVDIQVKNVIYTDVGSEGTKWEMRADLGTYLRQEKKALFEKVNVKLVLADGRTFIMQGDKGIFGTESKNINLAGHVTIMSDQGDKIDMDELNYGDKEKIFKTDSVVVYSNDRMILQGKGMILSLVEKKLKLLSAVKAEIMPRK